jgi:hypothetical protein
MAGAVFLAVLVIVIIVALVGLANPLILIPVVAIGLALLVVPLVIRALRGTSIGEPDGGPSGVPTTREASYDPVRER